MLNTVARFAENKPETRKLMKLSKYILIISPAMLSLTLFLGGKSLTFGQAPTPPNSEDKSAAASQQYNEAKALYKKTDPVSLELSMEKFKAAAKLFKETNNKQGEADSRFWIGFILQDLNKNSAALESYLQALPLYQAAKNKQWEAITLNDIGALYLELKQEKKALDYYNRALSLYREIGDKPREAGILGAIAGIYTNLDSVKATDIIGYYTAALKLYRDLRDGSGEAATLYNIAGTYFRAGDRQKALEFYHLALPVYERIGEKGDAADTMVEIGTLYIILMLPEKALGYFERAAEIYRETNNKEAENSARLIINRIYYSLNMGEKVVDSPNQSLAAIRNSVEEYMSVAVSLMMAGISGDEDETFENIKIALSGVDKQLSRAENEETGTYLIRLMMAGLFYVASQEKQKALEYFNKSLEVSRSEKIKDMEALMLFMIGVNKIESEPQTSVRNFKEAAGIFRSEGDRDMEAAMLLTLASAYGKLNENQEKPEYLTLAVNYINQALVIFRTTKNKTGEAGTFMLLMELWEEENQPALAILYGKQAINIFQSVRSELKTLDKKLQDSYLQRVSDAYQMLAEILIAQGRLAEAEQVLAMLKEQEFFEYLRRDDKVARELLATLTLTPTEQEAFRRYDELADSLTKIGKELNELQIESLKYKAGKFPKQMRLDELEKQLADANKVFNAFIDQLKIKFGQTDERVTKVDSGTQALLKELNQPRTVIISTIAGSNRLNLIVTTQSAQRAHVVDVKAADLNKLVFEFRDAVKNPSIDPRPVGRKLYNLLFPADLRKDLDNIKADTIIWSLDGTLRYLPIAALWDSKQYLAERYASAVITLASRDKINSQTNDRKNWTALGVGVSKSFEDFPPLAAVPEELCSVVNDAGSKDYCAALLKDKAGVITGRILPDEKFTLPDFKANLGRFPIIHVASHFSLNAGSESNSYLLLGGGSQRKWSLSAVRESGARFVGVDLLTLSVCNTAMTAGEKSNGLEVEGFGALAQKQGARSVLATLWAVADPSTKDLMTEFYRQLIVDKQISKAEALRRAQLKLLSGNYKNNQIPGWRSERIDLSQSDKNLPEFKKDMKAPFAHPYYWSPFVLIGNWQ